MNKSKITYVCILLVLMFYVASKPAHAGCSQRQLQNVCNSCAQQTLNSSQCMATSNPSSSCPACTDLTFQTLNYLRNSYTLSLSVKGDKTYSFTLSVSGKSASSFNYVVNNLQSGIQFNAVGLASGVAVDFSLPVVLSDGTFYTFDCSASISPGGALNGACGSIQLIGSRTGVVIGGPLTGT